jgi:hypothetical protein
MIEKRSKMNTKSIGKYIYVGLLFLAMHGQSLHAGQKEGQLSQAVFKHVLAGEDYYSIITDEKGVCRDGRLALVSKNGNMEELSIDKIMSFEKGDYPLKYDIHNKHIYFVEQTRCLNQVSHYIRDYSMEDVRISSNWKGMQTSQLKYKDIYEMKGVLMIRQSGGGPITRAYLMGSLKSSTLPEVFWDISVRETGEVRLYVLSDNKLEVWSTPPSDWRVARPRWTAVKTYDADISEPFTLIKDFNERVVIVAESGKLIRLDKDGTKTIGEFGEDDSDERILLVNKDADETLLTSARELEKEQPQVMILDGERLEKRPMNRQLREKVLKINALQKQQLKEENQKSAHGDPAERR